MKRLCFGGSFNPVHRAHLTCSAEAARAGGFDPVVLIPTGQPVLKTEIDVAGAADRLAMLQLAIDEFQTDANDPTTVSFEIDDLELRREGQTYTFDTVTALLHRGWPRVDWLIGADQLLSLHRWHRFEELLALAQFWVMDRPGYQIDWTAVHPQAQPLRDHLLPAPAWDVSATAVRARVRARESVDEWVSPNVREYIRRHRLYIR